MAAEEHADSCVLETCPVMQKALVREVDIVTELDDLLQGAEDLLYPHERRWAVDNMWTSSCGHSGDSP